MRIIFYILFTLTICCSSVYATDKYYTKTGEISFISDTPIIDIIGKNSQVASVINIKTGEMVFAVLMKSFKFKRALAEEHFNENYMESDKFPKSTFKGQIENLSEMNFSKDGTYPAKVKGTLTIHGVSKEIETEGSFTVAGSKIAAVSEFEVAVADYNISIPSVVKDNIAKTVKITLNADFEEFKK